MKIRPRFFSIAMGLLFLASEGLWACDDTVEYYLSCFGYGVQCHLDEKVSQEDASKSLSYYVAHFDKDRQLSKLVKMHKGQVFFDVSYFYANGKIIRSEQKDEFGKIKIYKYDANEKVIWDKSSK